MLLKWDTVSTEKDWYAIGKEHEIKNISLVDNKSWFSLSSSLFLPIRQEFCPLSSQVMLKTATCFSFLQEVQQKASHWHITDPAAGGTQLRGGEKPSDTEYRLLRMQETSYGTVLHISDLATLPCHAQTFLTYFCSDCYTHNLENHNPMHPSLITGKLLPLIPLGTYSGMLILSLSVQLPFADRHTRLHSLISSS